MNAATVLERVRTKYASCSSYTDRGRVDFSGPRGEDLTLMFRTSFVRPDYLTFEWQDYGPGRGKSETFSTLWTNGGPVIVRYSWDISSDRPLAQAIAGATGCSAGAASVITPLLLPEHIQYNRLKITDAVLNDDEVLDDEQCFVLTISLLRPADDRIWVSKHDYSIRKLLEDRSQTAEEAHEEYQKLKANVELVQKLQASGIQVPENVEPEAMKLLFEYTFEVARFDGPVERQDAPTL